ncbi:hypothetical protein [Streptomyces sp. NPDC050264]|uniref:hypothetical protein n=1 Tax=Streptomyces sp. NPDC050264 TaxID=3155038 RepID=UPI0034273073
MGTFAKTCGCSQPTRCPHPYFIRYRDAAGKQREETGFRTQDAAKERLVELYARRANTPASKAELIRHYGEMRFEDFVGDYMGRQRRLSYGTRMSLCPSPIRKSSARTSCGSRGTVVRV